MRILGFCLVGLLVAGQAAAGAWPREEGSVFASIGAEAFAGEGVTPTLYLEYGLTPRITLGFDGYLSAERDNGAGFAFARIPLTAPDRRTQIAAGLGFGALMLDEGIPGPAARATLHWGRGLERGWLAVDAEIAVSGADARPAKIDATWGRPLTDDWTAILLATVGSSRDGDSYATFSPSVAWAASDNLTLRLGLAQRLLGADATGVSAQLWLSF